METKEGKRDYRKLAVLAGVVLLCTALLGSYYFSEINAMTFRECNGKLDRYSHELCCQNLSQEEIIVELKAFAREHGCPQMQD